MVSAPLDSQATLDEGRILLVGSPDPSDDLRATFLREHGVQVDVASNVAGARSRWRPRSYRLILVDVRKHLPGEVADFCEEIKKECPEQKIAFLVGPPEYISLTWPDDVAGKMEEPQQRQETVNGLSAA